MDEDKEFAKLEEAVIDKGEQELELSNFISSIKSRHKIYKVGDIEVKIKPVLPRNCKQDLIKIFKEDGKLVSQVKNIQKECVDNPEKLEELIDSIYDPEGEVEKTKRLAKIVSELCLESPYNTESFWLAVDEQAGQLGNIFEEIFDILHDTENKIIKFR